jgi:hypothetical protein|tara:strand:- start:3332 stop:3589 length:258 start_codon:yes stop_codon:yes gene_type:complete
MRGKILIPVLLLAFILPACEKEEGCDGCGGSILDGYLFNEVTTEDLSALGTIEDIEVGACIRYKLDGTEFDLETVKIVDDCCCDQ